VSASWDDGRIVVLVPSRLGAAERDAVVDELVQRLLRRAPMLHSDDTELEERSAELADRYLDGVRATSVRWVGNQRRRWGSCSPGSGQIRVSDRLRPVPPWVLDAVLVHELAHLLEPTHSRRFRALAARYPRMAEADTFLHGFSVGLEKSDGSPHEDPEGLDNDESDETPDQPVNSNNFVACSERRRATSIPPAHSKEPMKTEPSRLFDPADWH